MIKVFNFKKKEYKKTLIQFLEKRRNKDSKEIKIVSKILKDIKKSKLKALLKYELKFSKNKRVKISVKEMNNCIKNLNPQVKKAIDFSFGRIKKFHSKQLKD